MIIGCQKVFLHHLLHNMLHLFYNDTPQEFTFVKKYLRNSFFVITQKLTVTDPIIKYFLNQKLTNYLSKL